MRWPVFLTLATAVLIAHSGCASGVDPRQFRLPPPPSETLRSQLGPVRVSVTVAETALVFEAPARGAGEGALRGAGIGAVGPAVLDPRLILLAPVGAVVGAVSGAAIAEPATVVEERQKAFQKAAAELKVEAAFNGCVAEAVTRATSPAGAAGAPGEDASTILEIVIEKFGLVGWGIDPPLRFVMTERTRLVRTSDGAELYRHWLTYGGRHRPLKDWVGEGGAPVREEAARACRELAERLVDEVFLLYLPAKERGPMR